MVVLRPKVPKMMNILAWGWRGGWSSIQRAGRFRAIRVAVAKRWEEEHLVSGGLMVVENFRTAFPIPSRVFEERTTKGHRSRHWVVYQNVSLVARGLIRTYGAFRTTSSWWMMVVTVMEHWSQIFPQLWVFVSTAFCRTGPSWRSYDSLCATPKLSTIKISSVVEGEERGG